MPRIKYWDETSQSWEYADQSVGGNDNSDAGNNGTLTIKLYDTKTSMINSEYDGTSDVSVNVSASNHKHKTSELDDDIIGSLDDLETTNKESIVAAINEVVANSGGSGESDVFIVTVIEDGIASHTSSEIKAAIDVGKAVFLNAEGTVVPMRMFIGDQAVFDFITIGTNGLNGDDIVHVAFGIDDTGAIEFHEKLKMTVPTPTEADYGKVLSATADGLVWVTPSGSAVPSAEGVEF